MTALLLLPTIVQILEVVYNYVDHIFLSYRNGCFFNIGMPVITLHDPKRVKLWNNMATIAGNSVYGGYIDKCSVVTSYNMSNRISGMEAFPILFEIPWNNSLTEVTSSIRDFCFCENNYPSCDHKERQVVIYSGQEILIPAVAVGQLKGTVPSAVVSEIAQSSDPEARISSKQDVQ